MLKWSKVDKFTDYAKVRGVTQIPVGLIAPQQPPTAQVSQKGCEVLLLGGNQELSWAMALLG